MADNAQRENTVLLPRWLATLCRWCAGIGGAVLLSVMAMTVISIVSRTLSGKPIPGDFELVELGSAIAIFCFLPWCQISGGNVRVDFVTAGATDRTNAALDALGDLTYLIIGAVLLWRMVPGAIGFWRYGDQTMVLRIPLWWGFLAILPAMALLVTATLFTMRAHFRQAAR